MWKGRLQHGPQSKCGPALCRQVSCSTSVWPCNSLLDSSPCHFWWPFPGCKYSIRRPCLGMAPCPKTTMQMQMGHSTWHHNSLSHRCVRVFPLRPRALRQMVPAASHSLQKPTPECLLPRACLKNTDLGHTTLDMCLHPDSTQNVRVPSVHTIQTCHLAGQKQQP